MKKNRTTKRALVSSILSLALCFAMLIGTTFAWFTDSVTSGSNVIKTGNLDLAVEYTLDGQTWNDLDGANDLFQKSLWEPGHTEVVVLKLENKGSLALKYTAQMNILKEIVGKNLDGDDIVLSDILTVSTFVHAVNDIGDISLMLAYANENASGLWSVGTTTSFKEMSVMDGQLLPGEARYAFIKVDMAETVGNEANHDGVNAPSIEFGLNILAAQLSYEEDSFGDQYDINAAFDEVWGLIADTSWYNDVDTEFTLDSNADLAGLAKLVNTGVDNFAGKTFKLANDVDLNNMNWFPIGTRENSFAGTFNGQGNTINNVNVDTQSSYGGLFGYVAKNASFSDFTVNNVVVKDATVGDDTTCYGAVVGYCPGVVTLNNVNVKGNIHISGEWYVAGLVGRSVGAKITNCSVVGEAGSVISSGRWAAGISGYDNAKDASAMTVSNCTVENFTIKSTSYAGGIIGLGSPKAVISDNTVKNVNIVLEGAEPENELTYGTLVGGVSVYSYTTNPIYVYGNTVDGVTCTVNTVAVDNQTMGSKYADGTDQGLIMMPSIKIGDAYYTYLKLAMAAAPKDGTQTVIELTGDTMITTKFKPQVVSGQNIVINTNGYDLIWVKQDSNKVPVTDAEGNLVTVVVTAENMSSYITVKSGGSLTIQ